MWTRPRLRSATAHNQTPVLCAPHLSVRDYQHVVPGELLGDGLDGPLVALERLPPMREARAHALTRVLQERKKERPTPVARRALRGPLLQERLLCDGLGAAIGRAKRGDTEGLGADAAQPCAIAPAQCALGRTAAGHCVAKGAAPETAHEHPSPHTSSGGCRSQLTPGARPHEEDSGAEWLSWAKATCRLIHS